MGKQWKQCQALFWGALTIYTHTHKSKWLKDLNLRHDTIKLLEENISKTFSNENHTYVFLGQSPKAIEILKKERSNQTHKLLHAKVGYQMYMESEVLEFCPPQQCFVTGQTR